MTPGRAAVYIGGAVVLAAWLAAASAPISPVDPQPAGQTVATSGTDRLASDIQAQSVRLRQRLASAPMPREPRRNPFAFVERARPHERVNPGRALAVEPAPPPIPSPPELTLVGVAEQRAATGIVRTAMIVGGGGGDFFMLREGQTLLGRYTVIAIGADAVELKDMLAPSTRRLALR